jgi:hypothetical protein
MTQELSQLASVIGEEIALGRDLLDNLAAQRQAILDWKIASLIERIESRETLLSNLGAVEQRRKQLVVRLAGTEDARSSLQEILYRVQPSAEAGELARLGGEARDLYTRLQTEEKSLLGLMENLLQHIHEALDPLTRPEVTLYGGSSASARAPSGLIQGKI